MHAQAEMYVALTTALLTLIYLVSIYTYGYLFSLRKDPLGMIPSGMLPNEITLFICYFASCMVAACAYCLTLIFIKAWFIFVPMCVFLSCIYYLKHYVINKELR